MKALTGGAVFLLVFVMKSPKNGRVWSVSVLAASMIALVLWGRQASADATYDVAADFDAGYAAGNNPNGPWTYGWSTNLTSALHVYPDRETDPQRPAMNVWDDRNNDLWQTPGVFKNTDGQQDGGWFPTHIPAGAFCLSGGGPSLHDFSHVVWTAPASGLYSLNATFTLVEEMVVQVDAYVLQNGSTLFSQAILGNDYNPYSFQAQLSLSAGDTIDFAVDEWPTGPYVPGVTQLQATITAVPEPSSLAVLGVGALGLLAYAWRRPRAAEDSGDQRIRAQG